MKTLHLTNAWHTTSGGVATFYRALIDAANRNRHSLRLVVPSDATRVEEVGAYGRIYHLEAPAAPVNRGYRMLYPHRFLWPGAAIHRIIAAEQPDLIEVCDKYTLNYLAGLVRQRWIPGLRIRPAVVGLSCERMDENMAAYLSASPLSRTFSRIYMKWLYFPLFDHHITVSAHTAAELVAASRGHKVQRGVWIRPMGADLQRFSPRHRSPEARRRLLRETGGGEHAVLLLYAGRLVPEKNLPLLVSLMERLKDDCEHDFRLVLAGDGILKEQVQKELSRRAPWRAAFIGHVPEPQELAEIYASCDVFIHPNPREPFGIAPLEAMASGLPLLAPNSGGVTSYANARNAWLADPSAEAFAAALRQVLDDPAAREAKVAAARATAEGYDWAHVTDAFLEIYQELHALNTGVKSGVTLAPHFFSTAGNWLGMESR